MKLDCLTVSAHTVRSIGAPESGLVFVVPGRRSQRIGTAPLLPNIGSGPGPRVSDDGVGLPGIDVEQPQFESGVGVFVDLSLIAGAKSLIAEFERNSRGKAESSNDSVPSVLQSDDRFDLILACLNNVVFDSCDIQVVREVESMTTSVRVSAGIGEEQSREL